MFGERYFKLLNWQYQKTSLLPVRVWELLSARKF